MVLSTLNACDLCLSRLCAHGLALLPHPCHPTGMDTSTTPRISPALEPETMMALMLRYVEDNEEAAYQYARTLVGAFAADPYIPDALQLTHDLVIESVDDILTFEGEEAASRINVALRQLLNRVKSELADRTAHPTLTM